MNCCTYELLKCGIKFHYLHYVPLLTNVHQWATTQILYISGIMLFRGPFRPYTSDNARSFIADVMDGYFPAEFKDKYPDGVAFEIKDSSDVFSSTSYPMTILRVLTSGDYAYIRWLC